MKTVLILCILLLLFAGCTAQQDSNIQSTLPEKPSGEKSVSAGSLDIANENFIVLDINDFN